MEQLAEFAGNHVLMTLALLGSFALVATYEIRLRANAGTQVSPGDAVKLINRAALVIDVRSDEAYAGGHIANARHVALADLEQDPDAIKKNKNKIVLAVCDSGTASGRAAAALRKAGFENAFSLRGGLNAWRAENLPLAK